MPESIGRLADVDGGRVQPADDGVVLDHGGARPGETEWLVEGDDESQVLRGEAAVQRGRLVGIRVAGDLGDVRAQGGCTRREWNSNPVMVTG